MFRFHDTTRRRICIAAFFVLCLVPTAGISAWCLWRQMPARTAGEAQRLTRTLGLDVSLDRLAHPRPGIVVYEEFGLSDPETGQVVLRCPALKTGWKETAAGQGGPKTALVLSASKPQIQAATLDHLGRLLDRILRRQIDCPPCDVWLSAGEAELRTDVDSHALEDLQGSIESHASGSRAQAVFRLAGVDGKEPIAIRIERDRRTVPPSTRVELSTGGSAVPCRLLALGWNAWQLWGPQSRFRGSLWARQTTDGWDGEMAGELIEVDLGNLLADDALEGCTATAHVTIHSARFHHGRLQEASGTVVAGRGAIDRRLIDRLADRLQLVQVVKPSGTGDVVPYEQLAFAFLLDSRGLQLRGQCAAAGRGAIMVDGYTCLLAEPLAQPQPIVGLWQTMAAGVPEASRLLRYLPVPQPADPEAVKSHVAGDLSHDMGT